ncbi:MAG TPA: metal-dependent hydrolase [Methanosarcina sp.]|nr:metal-dependent hydrolase [Methanosarcina sp.]
MLFFVFGITAAAVYASVRSIFHKGPYFKSSMRLLMLLVVGSLCSLFPDITAVYNLVVNGNMEHCWIGTFPTHSLLFSFLAILFGTLAGYTVYRKVGKAIYLGLFGEAAFFSHLLLDDACGAHCTYFYPIYNRPVSLFSVMNVGFEETGLLHYLMVSFVSVSFVCFFIAMAVFSLNQFGFEFKYRS